jgi:hypothetical protein
MPKTNQNLRSTHEALPTTYYSRLFRFLIEGLEAGRSYVDVAHLLNAHGVTTPTGRQWRDSSIKNTLKSLRNPARYPSRIATALVDLIARKELTTQEAAPLYELRTI